MFKTILIANRGEIACRVIETCRRLGIATVAVYSDADASARHVRLADRAVHIGPAPARESYLLGDRIIQVMKDTGAQAVHPGYGFLSENADFARQVQAAGLALIGPSPETMDLMGSKAAAKAKMEPAGVPLIPGYHGDDQSDDVLAAEAERVGFPLMLKAAAGGGGKGMRVVHGAEDFSAALAAARRESSAAFGDERMILERYLARPRHIEAQVFADTHGNTVHLFERDCSSQRRHQKIIEEAPAAGLSKALRAELLAAAVRAAKAVNYIGAGTVEFLVDGDEFFFLGMNTRLQVEHPVTERITGLDLVEWQIRVAAGQSLPLAQSEIKASGHAMEARIYAEDADQGFVPSTGRIEQAIFPDRRNVRIDTGVETGDEVSMHYDPMIAKLIVHGDTREQARGALIQARSQSFIAGPTTNLGFLQRLANSDTFADGTIDTNLLDRDPEIVSPKNEISDANFAIAAAAWLHRTDCENTPNPWTQSDGWRIGEHATRKIELQHLDLQKSIEVSGYAGRYQAHLDEQTLAIELQAIDQHAVQLRMNQKSERLHVFSDGKQRLDLVRKGQRQTFSRHEPLEAIRQTQSGEGRLIAPITHAGQGAHS